MENEPCFACAMCDFKTFNYTNLKQHFDLRHNGVLPKSIFRQVSEPTRTMIKNSDAILIKSRLIAAEMHLINCVEPLAPASEIKRERETLQPSLSQDLNVECENDSRLEEPEPCLEKLLKSFSVVESFIKGVPDYIKKGVPDNLEKRVPDYIKIEVPDDMEKEVPEVISASSDVDHIISGHKDLEVDIAGRPLLNLDESLPSAERRIDEEDENMAERDWHRESELNPLERHSASNSAVDCNFVRSDARLPYECIPTHTSVNLQRHREHAPQDDLVVENQTSSPNPNPNPDPNFPPSSQPAEFKGECKKSSAGVQRLPEKRQKSSTPSVDKKLPWNESDHNRKETMETARTTSPPVIVEIDKPLEQAKRSVRRHSTASPNNGKESEAGSLHCPKKSPSSKVSLVCVECGSSFKHRYSLKRHILRAHTGKREMKGTREGEMFTNQNEADAVEISAESGNQHEMGESSLPNTTLSLNADILKRDPSLDAVCSKVDQNNLPRHGRRRKRQTANFRFSPTLHDSMRAETGNGVKHFVCVHCTKRYHHIKSLKRHISMKHSFPCSNCSQIFNTHSGLQIHLKTHLVLKPKEGALSCSMCEYRCQQRHLLAIHMRKHTGEKPYSCSICGKRFMRTSNLRQHMDLHSLVKRHKCPYCEQAFKWRGGRQKHIFKKHTNTKKVSCDKCSKTFATPSSLHRHMKIHMCERLHSSKNDSRNEQMEREAAKNSLTNIQVDETRISGNDAPKHKAEVKAMEQHKCRVCKTVFMSVDSLRQHTCGHSTPYQYKCDTCSVSFLNLATLQFHQENMHKGERRGHACPHCGECFAFLSHYHRHLKTHSQLEYSQLKLFVCQLCGKACKSQSGLTRHMQFRSAEELSWQRQVCGEWENSF